MPRQLIDARQVRDHITKLSAGSYSAQSEQTPEIVVMRSISYGWQQDQIAGSAQEISDAARTLYDLISVFAGH